MDENELILAQSRPGILTIVLAVWSLGAAIALAWAVVTDDGDAKLLNSAPLVALLFGFVAVMLLWFSLQLLSERVVITARHVTMANVFRRHSIQWCHITKLGAAHNIWGRCIIGIAYKNRGSRQRWLNSFPLAFQIGYHDVIAALLNVAQSPEFRKPVSISPLLFEEAKRGAKKPVIK